MDIENVFYLVAGGAIVYFLANASKGVNVVVEETKSSLGEVKEGIDKWKSAHDLQIEAQASIRQTLQMAEPVLQSIRERTGYNVITMDDVFDLADKGLLYYNEITGTWDKWGF